MNFKFLYLIIFILLVTASCKKLKTPEAVAERQQWIESFKDSVELYKHQAQTIDSKLSECNAEIASILDNFEYVSNPREVNGYYILKGWKSKLPLTSTCIYARINEDENFEIIAVLSKGTFNSISVSDGSESAVSKVIHHDQALNYRHDGYNSVCFIGNAADSVAQFIFKHKNSRLELNFIEGNKKTSFTIPAEQKNMVADTWHLYASQLYQKDLEKQLWITSRKLDACRRMLENSDSIKP